MIKILSNGVDEILLTFRQEEHILIVAKKRCDSDISENENPGSLLHFRGFLFLLCKVA